jgi:oligopeptidase A
MSDVDVSAGDPLLGHEDVPRFAEISTDRMAPAVRALLDVQERARQALEQEHTPSWDGLAAPLAELAEPLSYGWGVVHHLLSVKNSPELREVEESLQPEVVAAALRLGQSRPFYDGFVKMRESSGWAALPPARQRIVQANIEQAELAGVALQGAAKERFLAVETELAQIGTSFSNHLLDATKAFSLILTTPEEADGLPPSLRAAAAQSARGHAGEDPRLAGATPEHGPWRITLEAPLYVPFMEHSRRRDLRERLYRAFVTRASSGELDNQPLILDTLRLRREKAALLGLGSYAELSLRRKMARSVAAVEALLAELRQASRRHALREHEELRAFARTRSGDPGLELALWDVPFWAERLREERYAFSEEELRPYFPLPAVLEGLFALARRLFGVVISPADGEAQVWHPDVRFFRVADEDGSPRAAFFLDPYSRPADKRGGAWMGTCLDRKRRQDGSVRRPVAYMVCNQAPPVDGQPSLMTFREVETLFHEFGHALQHMLTDVDEPEAAGINNVEWDAVELPSQFMENWCYHRPTLLSFARHHQTGAPLPVDLFDKVAAARTFRAGSQFLRQLHFATLDLELHARFDPDRDRLDDVRARVAAENSVIPPLPEDRFLCSFSPHLRGGYAAGYYSYKWAEVLSADAFAAFEEAGLEDAAALAETGRRFPPDRAGLGRQPPPRRRVRRLPRPPRPHRGPAPPQRPGHGLRRVRRRVRSGGRGWRRGRGRCRRWSRWLPAGGRGARPGCRPAWVPGARARGRRGGRGNRTSPLPRTPKDRRRWR